MSYILDALRRAESERERGSVPGLHAHSVGPSSTLAPAVSNVGVWAWPAIGVLVAAVVVLAWRPWADDAPRRVEPTTAPVAATPAPAPERPALPAPATVAVAPPAKTAATIRKPHSVAPPPSTAVAAAPKPTDAASASGNDSRVYALAELPPEIRRELPPVTIGGSIYSPSPESRFVMVGGQIFHEGDTLAPGLVLQQIRLKSAVLSFKGYRYSLTF